MVKHSSSEAGGSETKPANVEATSGTKTSHRKERPVIDLATRLRILQQAVHDYQDAGGLLQIIPVQAGTAIVLLDVKYVDGNLEV